MHILIIFINIGSYHAARLRAAYATCQQKGWGFTAVQVTDNTLEHPWGDLKQEITFPLKTLLPKNYTPLNLEQAANVLPSFLDNLQPDAVIIPGWGFSISRAALSWCRRHHIPTIVMSETKWDDEPRQWWKEKLKFWLRISKFDAALIGGKLHRDYLIKLGFPGNRIFSGYDTVDNNHFSKKAQIARQNPETARKRQPKIPTKLYFIVLTRLLKRKNVHRLVTAYGNYRQQVEIKPWDLVICGSGEEESNIHQLITQLKLNNYIHLPGFISYQALGDWYGLAGAFVHPALTEPWGLVVNEACAAGLPIICSRTVGSASELVQDGKNGLLFDPENTSDITRALVSISQISPETRTKMGELSQKIVANYSPENFAEGICQAIDITSCKVGTAHPTHE
ncbi:glycosyl transferase, group 1 family protein [Rivularia sp. IAM M-261]|nr:glycosyl transferase, group 1 family protein [Rivularia sp. IAM M-261]